MIRGAFWTDCARSQATFGNREVAFEDDTREAKARTGLALAVETVARMNK